MPPFVHKKGCSLKISALFVARRRILNSDEITHAAAEGSPNKRVRPRGGVYGFRELLCQKAGD